MLQLLRILVIIVVVYLTTDNPGITVEYRTGMLPFCGYTTNRTSTCHGAEIYSPFWIENGRMVDDTGRECMGYPGFQLKCATNGRLLINISNHLYNVNRESFSLFLGETQALKGVVDVDIEAQDCPQPRRNFSIGSDQRFLWEGSHRYMTIFYNCSRYPPDVVENMPCLNQNNKSNSSRSFAAFLEGENQSDQFDWYGNCEEAVVVPVEEKGGLETRNYTRALKDGFLLFYKYPVNCRNCELSGGKCLASETFLPVTTSFHCICPGRSARRDDICPGSYKESFYSFWNEEEGMSMGQKIVIVISVIVGGVLLCLLVLYRRKCYLLFNSIVSRCRRKIKGPTNVEIFLDDNNGGLSSRSYKYSDIKKMTNSFKDALGQGGFGSVFKGKLRDGRLVAVKVLNESKGKGEDFINEVATIGKTNHVNVVSLLGFCAEGTKRALIYEFMSNGSLEKFIHTAKDSSTTSSFLGWEKLYKISLGIARGLEYLHRGCNTHILHFDIKPHNILLDQEFRPKISDFGLAKLCPTTASLVSMVGARGTPGYIATEVCCGNFGGVSHKSDVYSYGMMVLEMIGRRKNMDIFVENASQIYFPQWIYKRLRGNYKVEESEEIEVTDLAGGVLKEETARKMIMVALWCIQAHPADRPSMTKVVELLEGNIEDIQFPSNPFPDPSSSSLLP